MCEARGNAWCLPPDGVTAHKFMSPGLLRRPECQRPGFIQGILRRYAQELTNEGPAPGVVITDVFIKFPACPR